MTAVDVDLDVLWELDSFEVFLTPLRATAVVFPEKPASIGSYQGVTVAQASWEVPGSAYVDGVRCRLGEKSISLPCEPRHAFNGVLTILVPLDDLS